MTDPTSLTVECPAEHMPQHVPSVPGSAFFSPVARAMGWRSMNTWLVGNGPTAEDLAGNLPCPRNHTGLRARRRSMAAGRLWRLAWPRTVWSNSRLDRSSRNYGN